MSASSPKSYIYTTTSSTVPMQFDPPKERAALVPVSTRKAGIFTTKVPSSMSKKKTSAGKAAQGTPVGKGTGTGTADWEF